MVRATASLALFTVCVGMTPKTYPQQTQSISDVSLSLFLILTPGHFFPLLLERGGGREREKHQCERNISWLPLVRTLTGMCPDQKLNPQPFGHRTALQPTEPTPARAGCLLMAANRLALTEQACRYRCEHWIPKQIPHVAKLKYRVQAAGLLNSFAG